MTEKGLRSHGYAEVETRRGNGWRKKVKVKRKRRLNGDWISEVK